MSPHLNLNQYGQITAGEYLRWKASTPAVLHLRIIRRITCDKKWVYRIPSVPEYCKNWEMSRATFYRALKNENACLKNEISNPGKPFDARDSEILYSSSIILSSSIHSAETGFDFTEEKRPTGDDSSVRPSDRSRSTGPSGDGTSGKDIPPSSLTGETAAEGVDDDCRFEIPGPDGRMKLVNYRDYSAFIRSRS